MIGREALVIGAMLGALVMLWLDGGQVNAEANTGKRAIRYWRGAGILLINGVSTGILLSSAHGIVLRWLAIPAIATLALLGFLPNGSRFRSLLFGALLGLSVSGILWAIALRQAV